MNFIFILMVLFFPISAFSQETFSKKQDSDIKNTKENCLEELNCPKKLLLDSLLTFDSFNIEGRVLQPSAEFDRFPYHFELSISNEH